MQQYLTFAGSIERPTFKDINTAKSQDEYPGAYRTEITETFNTMSKVKSPNSGVITTGLWPLDHESYYDWRHSTHKKSIWTQWIYMARIEKIIVERYRPRMLRKCPASALIRDTLASELSPLCSMMIVAIPKGKKGEKIPEKKFYWPDNIKVGPPVIQGNVGVADEESGVHPTDTREKAVGKVVIKLDVDEMRAEQSRRENTNAMIADVTAIFKKLHATPAGVAVRGRQGFPRLLVKKLNDLEDVCAVCLFTLEPTISLWSAIP